MGCVHVRVCTGVGCVHVRVCTGVKCVHVRVCTGVGWCVHVRVCTSVGCVHVRMCTSVGCGCALLWGVYSGVYLISLVSRLKMGLCEIDTLMHTCHTKFEIYNCRLIKIYGLLKTPNHTHHTYTHKHTHNAKL